MFGERKVKPKLWLLPRENTVVGLQCICHRSQHLYRIRNEGILQIPFINLPCLPLPSFGQGQTVQLASLLFAVRFPPQCLVDIKLGQVWQ